MAELAPGHVTDRGVGPVPTPGVPVEVASGVVRLTAPNPSMMTGPGTNTYLIGDDELLVLDPGPDLVPHRGAIVEAVAGRAVIAVAVTHTHLDHAPGAAPLARVLGAPTAGFADGDGFLADRLLSDGDLLGAGRFELEVVHTPGHASAHCCFVLPAERLCFTGDHVMHGSTVVIRPPDGSMAAYLGSLDRLLSLTPALKRLAPGHGRLIGDPAGAITELIEHRAAREQLVLVQLRSVGRASADDLTDLGYPGLEERRRSVATATLLAHLGHLVERGAARQVGGLGPGDPAAAFEAITS